MLKEALQYLVNLGSNKVERFDIDGRVFLSHDLKELPESRPTPLKVHNLSGLVDYLKSNYDKQPPVLIQVASPTEVNVFSTYNRDMRRNCLIQAEALLPSIPFEKFLDIERFNVLLQSCFVENDYRSKLLAVVGNVKEENVANFGDDGIAQSVVAKTGVATVDNVKVPNPVYLKPYRTFVDIEQPESRFVFRMQTGPAAALFEADGGAWKLEAIYHIRKHLTQELEDIKDRVTIIA